LLLDDDPCFKNDLRPHSTCIHNILISAVFASVFCSCCSICPVGRKREWFPVDEAIKVLQSHKPVHAEYLRRLRISRPSSTTNGNLLLPQTSPSTLTPLFSAPASAARR
uniref:Uncharacterized protein n=1 Tax=Sinocyclocheilus rhinocerous TaxID=307959 RepID=A0A673GAF7_9TELE